MGTGTETEVQQPKDAAPVEGDIVDSTEQTDGSAPTEVLDPEVDAKIQEAVKKAVADASKAKEDEMMERIKGLNRAVTNKDLELKALQSQSTSPTTIASLKKLADSMMERFGEDASEKELAQLASIREEISKAEQAQAYSYAVAVRDEMQSRMKEKGYDINDPLFYQSRAFYKQGLFEEAMQSLEITLNERGAKKVEVKGTTTVAAKTGGTDEREALKSELRAEIMKELNLDAQDSLSGGSGAIKTFTRSGIAKMSDEEFKKNEADINKAMMAGKILNK